MWDYIAHTLYSMRAEIRGQNIALFELQCAKVHLGGLRFLLTCA